MGLFDFLRKDKTKTTEVALKRDDDDESKRSEEHTSELQSQR